MKTSAGRLASCCRGAAKNVAAFQGVRPRLRRTPASGPRSNGKLNEHHLAGSLLPASPVEFFLGLPERCHLARVRSEIANGLADRFSTSRRWAVRQWPDGSSGPGFPERDPAGHRSSRLLFQLGAGGVLVAGRRRRGALRGFASVVCGYRIAHQDAADQPFPPRRWKRQSTLRPRETRASSADGRCRRLRHSQRISCQGLSWILTA